MRNKIVSLLLLIPLLAHGAGGTAATKLVGPNGTIYEDVGGNSLSFPTLTLNALSYINGSGNMVPLTLGSGLSLNTSTGTLSATATGGVTSFDTRTGAVTLEPSDLSTANGFGSGLSTALTNSLGAAGGIAGVSTANAFTQTQSLPGINVPTFAGGGFAIQIGNSRDYGNYAGNASFYDSVLVGGNLLANLCETGPLNNSFGIELGVPGCGLENILLWYTDADFTTTGNITSGTSITITGSTSNIAVNQVVMASTSGGTNLIPVSMIVSNVSGSTITIHDYTGLGRTMTTANGVTLHFAPPIPAYAGLGNTIYANYMNPLHQLSPAVSGIQNTHLIMPDFINDVQTPFTVTGQMTNGTNTFTITNANYNNNCLPLVGEVIANASGFVSNTTVTAVSMSPLSNNNATVTTSNNWTGSSAGYTLTITPNATSIENTYASLMTLAEADGYNNTTNGNTITVKTTPKGWTGAWLAGDTLRQTVNSSLISSYASGTTGVNVADVAGMGIFSTDNPYIYAQQDGYQLHFNPLAYNLMANLVTTDFLASFSSMMTGPAYSPGQAQMNPDIIGTLPSLNVGGGPSNSANGSALSYLTLTTTGGGGTFENYVNPTGTFKAGFGGSNFYIDGTNQIEVPTATAGTVALTSQLYGGNSSLSISTTGTTTLTGTGPVNSSALTFGTGSGAYTSSIVLSDSGVSAGMIYEVWLSLPASSNPTINIYDASTGGTLLATPVINGTAGSTTLQFVNNGTAWSLYNKGAALAYRNGADFQSASTTLSNLGGAPLASPTFTGTPAAPTASGGTNTTQLATTAFVQAALPSLPLSIANGGIGAATAAQNSVFAGPASGGTGAPSFQTAPTIAGLTVNTGSVETAITVTSSNTIGTLFALNNTSTGAHSFDFFATGSGNSPGWFGVYDAVSSVTSFAVSGNAMHLPTVGVLGWSGTSATTEAAADTALSRDSAGVIDFGTGAAGSTAGSWKVTNGTLSGTLTLSGGGTVTLSAGSGTISNTLITTNSVVMLTTKTAGGTQGVYSPLTAVTTGTCTVTSLSTDTSTYNYVIINN